jgi:hypothetical protein
VKLRTVSVAYILCVVLSDRLSVKRTAIVGLVLACFGLIPTVLLRIFSAEMKLANPWIQQGSVVLAFLALLVGAMLLLSWCAKRAYPHVGI